MRKPRLGEFQLPESIQLGLKTNSRGLRSAMSFRSLPGQVHGMLRARGEGGMGERREQPLVLSFPCPPGSVLWDCVCVLFSEARPSQTSLAMHSVQRQSLTSNKLKASQLCSRTPAWQPGMEGWCWGHKGWQHWILQQIRQPWAVRELWAGPWVTEDSRDLPLAQDTPCNGSWGCEPGLWSALPWLHHAKVWKTIRWWGEGLPLLWLITRT